MIVAEFAFTIVNQDEDDQKYDTATYAEISQIKGPPSIESKAQQIYVKKIDIQKIDNFSEAYAIAQVAYRSTCNKRHRDSYNQVVAVPVDVIKEKWQNNKSQKQIESW